MNKITNGRRKFRAVPVEENKLMDACNIMEGRDRDYEMLELVLWPNQAS